MLINDTTNRMGIVQLLEDLTTTQSSTTSSYPLRTKIRDINLSFDDYFMLAIQSSGTWQVDDTNQTDYPNATTNLVASQQDYSFILDESNNFILDIYRVECKDANGNWQLLQPYDENDEQTALSEQATTTGTPTRYSKTSNGIMLDRIPNYNSTNGLKIFFARTPYYFAVAIDDSVSPTRPGIPNAHHRYLAIKPAYWYWLTKDNQKATIFKNEVLEMEKSIQEYYSERTKDEKPRLIIKPQNNR